MLTVLIVLTVLAPRPTQGAETTTWLWDQGLIDTGEGTAYGLIIGVERRGLFEIEKVSSEKGPLRKMYSITAR